MENENTQPQTTSGSKKTLWYIIGAIIILILGSNFLWGIFARNTAERMMESASGGKVNIDRDGTMTYKTDQGTAVIGKNKLPDNWPADVPQYPNANIQFSASSNMQNGKPGIAVTFQTKDSVSEVISFFKKELASNGWKVDSETNIGAMSILSENKSGRGFMAQATTDGVNGTQVTMAVSSN